MQEDHGDYAASSASISAARLVQRLPVLQLGIGVGDDAAAGLEVYPPPERQIGADHDAGVHRAGGAEIADRAAVHAPPRRLQLGDDLHGPDLGRAGDRAAGKGRAEQVDGVGAGRRARRRRSRPGGGPSDAAPARTAPAPARVPGRQTRERSLRSRSTIITFSARSLSLSASARPSAASCIGPRPAGPGALDRPGLDVAPLSSSRRKRSGEALSTVSVAEVEIGGERGGVPRAGAGGRARTAARAAAPGSAATGWPGRCRRRRCTRAPGRRRRGSRGG